MFRQNRRNYQRFQENNSFNKQWRGGRGYRPYIQNYYNDNNYNNGFYDNGYNYNYYNNRNNYNYFNNYKYDKNNNKHGNNYYNKFGNGYYNYYYNKFDRRRNQFIEIDLGETNNEIDEKIKNELESLGYYVVEAKGDGNCLFRSVSEQIEGDENNYKKYRERCVDYILQNKDDFAPFLDEDEPFDNYIEKISKDGEWGGNLEIYALSMALEANFCIYIYNQPCYVIKNWEIPKYNIFLSYHNGKHFNSFRKSNKDKKEEEKEGKEDKEEKVEKEEKIENVEKSKEKKEEQVEKEEKEENEEKAKEKREDKNQNEIFEKDEENKSKIEEIKENINEKQREEVKEKSNEEKKESSIENNKLNKEEKPLDDIDEFLSKVSHLNI